MDALTVIGIGIAIYLLGKSTLDTVASNINIGQLKLHIVSATYTQLNIKLTLPIENNSSVSIPVESAQGAIFYGQWELAQVNMLNPIVIQANTTQDIVFDVTVQFIDLATDLVQLFTLSDWQQNFYFEGIVKSSGLDIPVYQNLITA